jgi:hypothetical protein
VVTSTLSDTAADPSQPFAALSMDERNHLREWRVAARMIDVDAVEDLASRPWPVPITGTVIGVFQAGDEAATWLVIGQNGTWAVADCGMSRVSRSFYSLAEALAAIYPGRSAGRSV